MIFLPYRPPLVPIKTKQNKKTSKKKLWTQNKNKAQQKFKTQVLRCTVPTVRDCKKVRQHTVPLERKENAKQKISKTKQNQTKKKPTKNSIWNKFWEQAYMLWANNEQFQWGKHTHNKKVK